MQSKQIKSPNLCITNLPRCHQMWQLLCEAECATGMGFNGVVIDLQQHFETYPNYQILLKFTSKIYNNVADFRQLRAVESQPWRTIIWLSDKTAKAALHCLLPPSIPSSLLPPVKQSPRSSPARRQRRRQTREGSSQIVVDNIGNLFISRESKVGYGVWIASCFPSIDV